MASTIYIVEAFALIEGIHTLKQWVYDGKAQLIIPTTSKSNIKAPSFHS